jgi:hypothetical protein
MADQDFFAQGKKTKVRGQEMRKMLEHNARKDRVTQYVGALPKFTEFYPEGD